MRIHLLPDFTDAEKATLGTYLGQLLDSPRLADDRRRYPLENGRIGLYVDGKFYCLTNGTWQFNDPYLYVGQDSHNNNALPVLDRLGVIAAIIATGGLWTDEMIAKFGITVSRIMLQSYNEMMHGLLTVQGTTPATGLAFRADRQQVAALMGDRYFLPSGETVEVDESWTIVQ